MAFTYPTIAKDISLKIYINNDLIWTVENGHLLQGDGLWGKGKYNFNDFTIKSIIDGYDELEVQKDGRVSEGARHRLMFRFPYSEGDIKVSKKVSEGFFGNTYANFAEIKVRGRQPRVDPDQDLFKVIGTLLLKELESQEASLKQAA